MQRPLAAALVVMASAAAAVSAGEHFTVSASYVPPAKPRAGASVAVSFTPVDPDVRINQEPGPRLKLDPEQAVLVFVERQPPAARRPESGGEPKYLDPSLPVTFAVALNPKAPRGEQPVKGSVTYFYCSKREGWCRKGTSEVAFTVNVP
ncbi:MAG: hypothetical protein DMF80_22730 [Acidobacteria bacterium]|nr:MAG: hypothetical protein DMF80_22730 [Acidobacteriota bacterium]